MAHLHLSNIQKSYGPHKILHGISLEVRAGEFLSLLGPSGCGKTTTLRCIAGLERPDRTSGQIKINEEVLSGGSQFVKPENRQFGMVFQSYAVWPHMNVFENVAFPLRTRKSLDETTIKNKVFAALDLVHLTGLDKRFGHELSGGQQQRVALARSLAMSPRLLLLDEPLSNLDVLLREELRAEIQRLQRELKMTTILVTHDQKEALSMSHRIVLMNKGQIDCQGTPEELFHKPPTEFAAEFLASAQRVTAHGETKQFIPRKWKVNEGGSSINGQIVSRLFIGNEYEYFAQTVQYKEPLKFFSQKSFEPQQTVTLTYSP